MLSPNPSLILDGQGQPNAPYLRSFQPFFLVSQDSHPDLVPPLPLCHFPSLTALVSPDTTSVLWSEDIRSRNHFLVILKGNAK